MYSSISYQRKQLRQIIQAKRLALSEFTQNQASLSVCHQALHYLSSTSFHTIALYLPFRGEISPLPLLQQLQQQGKYCVLPVLHPFSHHYLQFIRYEFEQELVFNRFGILEPRLDVRKIIPLDEIELMFVPLVACDKQHNRLGMGGGFYDRTLALMPHCTTIGLAHQCQVVERLPVEDWDVSLDHIFIG